MSLFLLMSLFARTTPETISAATIAIDRAA
jgi:hypothetical protein